MFPAGLRDQLERDPQSVSTVENRPPATTRTVARLPSRGRASVISGPRIPAQVRPAQLHLGDRGCGGDSDASGAAR